MLVTDSIRIIKVDIWDAIQTACKNVNLNSKDIEYPKNSRKLQTNNVWSRKFDGEHIGIYALHKEICAR